MQKGKLFKSLFLIILVMFVLSACSSREIEQSEEGEETIERDVIVAEGEAGNAADADTTDNIDFEIVNTYHYVNKLGYYHITGAVKNTGTVPVKHVRVKLKALTSSGEEEEWGDRVVHPSRLEPGEVAVFDESMGKEEKYAVGKYEITPEGGVADDEDHYTALEVRNVHVEEIGGYYKVYAEVTNVGDGQSPMYWAVCQFYDTNGNVITSSVSPINKGGTGLKPGDSMTVRFITYHPTKSIKIASQKVVVDFSR